MFEGRFVNTLDDKGRVALPAKYREALSASGQEKIVVTSFDIGDVPCLMGYPAPAWRELVAKIQAKDGAFAHARTLFESVYIGDAQPCHPDKQGRILLPENLREHALLDGEVIFVGLIEKFQIFNPEQRKKVNEQYRTLKRENPNLFHDVD